MTWKSEFWDTRTRIFNFVFFSFFWTTHSYRIKFSVRTTVLVSSRNYRFPGRKCQTVAVFMIKIGRAQYHNTTVIIYIFTYVHVHCTVIIILYLWEKQSNDEIRAKCSGSHYCRADGSAEDVDAEDGFANCFVFFFFLSFWNSNLSSSGRKKFQSLVRRAQRGRLHESMKFSSFHPAYKIFYIQSKRRSVRWVSEIHLFFTLFGVFYGFKTSIFTSPICF